MGFESYGSEVEQVMLNQILEVIASKKASYAREISRETGYTSGEISRLLYRLEDAGVLEQLVPKKKLSDQRLLDRRKDLWKRGLKGLDAWRKMNWFGLNSELSWKLSAREHDFYVDEHHRILKPGDLATGLYETPRDYADKVVNNG